MNRHDWTRAMLLAALCVATAEVNAQATAPNAPTEATRAANAKVLARLPFSDKQDFEDVRRGFVGALPEETIRNAEGKPVFDLTKYYFLRSAEEAPATVNPSLWRQERLVVTAGLFMVTERIYQVRGYDLSNMTVVEGDDGLIVFDPLTSAETAKAALELYFTHRPKKPIVAVVYSHSHADHFAGVKGIVSDDDVRAGKVQIIAPEHFLEHAISENVMAGNVMGRRASYMYGNLLPPGPSGSVGAGLGLTTPSGSVTLIPPTREIKKTGEEVTIAGVKMVFQMTPNTEAPAEMNTYFPQMKALWMAENTTHTLHNIYTLRGALVRDAKVWSQFINEAIELHGGSADVVLAAHHWPTWGNERIVNYLRKQRDVYKYLHDQTLRLANQGYTMLEIAEMFELPPELASAWAGRDYYGTVSHNVKAVYNRYLGFFDGNPANLNPLPPEASARKHVEFMGGAEAVLKNAQVAYDNGEYRWVAQVVNYVVFADPDNRAARELQAAALEQMGYQAESGPWRNFYLSGAKELRDGVIKAGTPTTATADITRAMTPDMFFDFMAVRLNGPKANGRRIAINIDFTDTGRKYALVLENSVLNHVAGKQTAGADATFRMSRSDFDDVLLRRATMESKVVAGNVKIEGNAQKFAELVALLDNFEFWFNIVTP